jgi:hypothetical protein
VQVEKIIETTVDSIARRQSGEFATDCGSQTLAAQTVVLATDVVDIEPKLPQPSRRHPSRTDPALPCLRRVRGDRSAHRRNRHRSKGVREALFISHFAPDLALFTLDASVRDA